MRCAGIVLCGGQSSRMGWPKAMLPFGPERMLQRVVRLLAEATEPVVVAAAMGQELPELPVGVRVVHDCREGRGPLEGLLAGLTAVEQACELAFATGCDVPLLVPAFVDRICDLLGNHDVAVPRIDGFHHSLAAVYRTRVRPHIEALLAEDRLRPRFLFDRLDTRLVTAEELSEVDPQLRTLRNLNRPEDYLAALAQAGFEAPAEVLEALQDRPQ